jgi:hypothetical protein
MYQHSMEQIIYGLLASFAGPFYVVPLQQIAMRTIGDHMGTKNMFSLVIAREISLTSGRVLGMIFVVLLSLVFPQNFIMIAVTVLSVFPLGLTLSGIFCFKTKDCDCAIIVS